MKLYAPIFDDSFESAQALRELIEETASDHAEVSVEMFDSPSLLMEKLSSTSSDLKLCFVDLFIQGLEDLGVVGRPDISTRGGTRAGVEIVNNFMMNAPKSAEVLGTKFAVVSSYPDDLGRAESEFLVSSDGVESAVAIKFFRKPASVNDNDSLAIKNYILSEISQFQLNKYSAQKERIGINLVPLVFTVSSLIDQFDSFKLEVQSNNYFAVHEPEKHENLISLLEKILSDLANLLDALPTSPDEVTDEIADQMSGWFATFRSELEEVAQDYVSPSNVAKSVVPLGIILSCGTVGALIGGPLGFGAGSVFGQYITGHVKPGAMSDKLGDMFSRDTET